ncbi:MAG: hypothetical protein ACTSQP_10025 [Promethearchaeota archaeon]
MENNKILNIASIIYIYGVAMVIIFGLLYVINGSFQSYHIAYMGIDATDVKDFNPELMILISIFIRLLGFCLIFIGISEIIIILTWFREGNKNAWIIQLMITLIIGIPFSIITSIVGGTPFIVSLTVLIGDGIATALSAKVIFVD